MRLNDSIRSPCTSAAIGKADFKHSFWENGVAAVKMSPKFDDKLMSMQWSDIVELYKSANSAAVRMRPSFFFFLSDEMQRAHGDAAQAINAGYLRNFPSLGPNA